MCMTKRRSETSGSKRSASPSDASMVASAASTERAKSCARGVGITPPGVRTNSWSLSRSRRRVRPWLTAGCDNPICSAARRTLRAT